MSTTYSTQVTNDMGKPPVMNENSGYLHPRNWDYTVVGAPLVANDVVGVVNVPAGCKVYMPLSVMKLSASQGSGTTINIGHMAYKDKNGATIAANANALGSGYTATSVAVNSLAPGTPIGAGSATNDLGIMDFSDAHSDVTITLTAVGGSYDGDIGDVYEGYFMVTLGNK